MKFLVLYECLECEKRKLLEVETDGITMAMSRSEVEDRLYPFYPVSCERCGADEFDVITWRYPRELVEGESDAKN